MTAASDTSFVERFGPLEQSHFWFVGRTDLVANLLRRLAGDGPVIDVGCGTGAFASQLGTGRSGVVALDRELRTDPRLAVAGVRADAERLPLRSGSAGVVLARDVLEHVDDEAALTEWARVLRAGGLLVVLVPAWPALWSRRDERAGHRRRYTRATLRHALATAGFELMELRGYQFALLPLAALSRLASRTRPDAQLRAEEQPPAVVNRVLAGVNRSEAKLARVSWLRPPTGSSLVAVARRT